MEKMRISTSKNSQMEIMLKKTTTKGIIPTLMRMRAMTIMSMGATAIVAARKMRDLRLTRRMNMV